jgi:hypothetical protein
MQKINEFIFDLFSLFVPGIIAVSVIGYAIYDYENMDLSSIYQSGILDEYILLVFLVIFIISYIAGSVVKVFSKFYYNIAVIIFDQFIIVILQYTIKKLYTVSRVELLVKRKTPVVYTVASLLRTILSQLKSMFTFSVSNYSTDLEPIYKKVSASVKSKFDLDEVNWHMIYKYSNIASIRNDSYSITYKFLSKYNFYRSIAFVMFILALLPLIADYTLGIYYYMVVIVSVLAANVKYKNYWTRCGNEALMELYYELFDSEEGVNDERKNPIYRHRNRRNKSRC